MSVDLPERMRGVSARVRAHPRESLEVALALALAMLPLASEGPRSILAAVVEAAGLAALAVLRFMLSDPAEILPSALASLAIPLLLFVPVGRAVLHVPAHRRVWLAPYLLFVTLLLPMTFAALSTPAWWLATTLAALVGFVAARHRGWRVLALLPTLLIMRPLLGHSPLGDRWWTPARLADRCEANAGERAAGVDPQRFATRHYAVTPVRDDLALFTSERSSAWLHLDAHGHARLGESIPLFGNIWQGCLDAGTIWLTKRGLVMRIAIPDELAQTQVETFEIPDPPEMPRELDFADAVCGLGEDRVLVTEVVQGGIRDIDVASGEQLRTQLGGLNIQALRRPDDLVVGIDTARLFVFDPDARALVWRESAGICVMGLDLCADDGRVALTDMAGRVRIYAPRGEGYERVASLALRAPRRIAFSPDCTRLAVSSADDATVYLLASDPLELLAEHEVGPGLRDLAFVDARTVALADACMVTTLTVP